MSDDDFLERTARYARLRREQSGREAEAEAIKHDADELEKTLLEDFAAHNTRRINIEGVTVYLDRTLWARIEEGATKDQVIEGLIAAGHGEFVHPSYNSNTVSGWLRELEKNDEKLPAPLVGVLGHSEVFRLKTRKS